MKDSLNEFVNDHRNEFDDKEPASKVWNNIESKLPLHKGISIWANVLVWRAAAIVFFGLSLYLFFAPKNTSGGHDSVALQGEFSNLELFYSQQIADKIELIDNIQNLDEEAVFVQDLEKLDAMYQVLREQMKSNPSEEVKDALILNMLVRIDLLNQQIANLERSKEKPDNKVAI